MTDASLIDIAGACVIRKRRHILDRIDLTVGRHEIVTLIGPNGAGKSTVVRLALGLIAPDDGSVTRAPGLRIGYQPQRTAIEQTLPMTVRRLMTLTDRHEPAAIKAALARLGMADMIDADVHTLSGGELQRAMLARAFLRKPDLLVLDEPTQNLDIAGAVEIYRVIAEMRDELGCGVLLVSHDLNVVMAATNRVYCLNGHVCCSGHPESVTRHPEFLRLFGSNAAGALAVYTHAHDHDHAPGHNRGDGHHHHHDRHGPH
ncbi:MAG: metal ABC transporter ATP-binding protein [Alphaproteobacteria bacterium]|nr:metal ABC transporter ATP-binding protein [Alphaproteobacteria bacterium]